MTDDGFERLVTALERELDHRTEYYERKHLRRRITARMRRRGFDEDDFGGYLDAVRDDDEEKRALLDTMSINVTGLFRNPDVWRGIREVLATLADDRRLIRAWSVPCSDGREAYSLAMLCLDDDRVDTDAVSIRGSDIDPEALAVAERGVYGSSRADDVEVGIDDFDPSFASYLEREQDGRYRVRDDVADLVSFDRHDVIDAPADREYDLVLCRNLLIYIEERYKPSLFDHLGASLADGGYLVIGKTETLPPSLRQRYKAFDSERRIYRRTDG